MRLASEAEIAAALAGVTASSPRVVVSGNLATPWRLVELLEGAVSTSVVFVLNPLQGWTERSGITIETPFVGPGCRSRTSVSYLPTRLSLVPRLFETTRPPDVVLVQTSAPRGQRVSLGIEVNILPAAIEAVRRRGGLIIAQLNARMPYTFGDGELDIEDIDLALEDDTELPQLERLAADPASSEIAERIARYACDGGTIQSGIGKIPEAVLGRLQSFRGLGVWSEMVSDGLMELERAGSLDEARPIAATFLCGTSELYEWANESPRLVMRRTEVVNDPGRISMQPAMLSINAALEVDLFDQANASYVRGRIYSGFGGQPDFVSGALHSEGGHSVVALHAWHDGTDSSTIVPVLSTPATSFQHSVVVTEHGAAELFGRSEAEQANLLITYAADPRAQDDLRTAAARSHQGR
jgi:acyl-CoA hydrolase